MRMPMECFEAAAAALRERYGHDGDHVSDGEGA
jgi:hypothetical protein